MKMKAETVFLTSITCALLLETQIAEPPQAISKPPPIESVIHEISECLIPEFGSRKEARMDIDVPYRVITPPQKMEVSKCSDVPTKIGKTSAQTEAFLEPPAEEVASSQSSQSTTPKMGDTRVVDGQKQCYFLGFGWIDDNDEPNDCIYAEDMYENGNKIGSMSGGTFVDGDGDINKMVGSMD